VRKALPETDVMVVDDGSPDGTADIVDAYGKKDPHVSVHRRTAKLGLGVAYIDAFRTVLPRGYEGIICMDADFSHDPAVLPKMVEALEAGNDFVIGSRYIPGGSTPDWKFSRRMISRVGNLTARTLLGVPMKDNTTGYRGYRREALQKLDFDNIKLTGYGFMIETAFQNYLNGMKIKEIPITFLDRRVGKSKMSGSIVKEALLYCVTLRLKRIKGQIFGDAKASK
jgi:dolichol-phosphate mannosyltransferase